MASFKSAFAAARKAGKKVFTWEGKRYNTKLSNGTPATVKAPGSRPAKLPDSVKVPSAKPGTKKTAAAKAEPSIKEGIAKAAVKSGASRSTTGKAIGMKSGPDLSIGSRVKRSIAIGKTAVDRKHRREDAQKANKGAADAVSKMLKGMDKKKK